MWKNTVIPLCCLICRVALCVVTSTFGLTLRKYACGPKPRCKYTQCNNSFNIFSGMGSERGEPCRSFTARLHVLQRVWCRSYWWLEAVGVLFKMRPLYGMWTASYRLGGLRVHISSNRDRRSQGNLHGMSETRMHEDRHAPK